MLDPHAYCDRIGYAGSRQPTLETLRHLHRAHMLSVPFENLDIPLAIPIVLDEAAFYQKVVGDRRGGFCYELNGLFAALLKHLGFRVTYLAGAVFKSGQPGNRFSHLALRVDLETPWLVDVGFGDSSLAPISLAPDATHPNNPGQDGHNGATYRCLTTETGWLLQEKRPNQAWAPQYQVANTPRQLADFEDACRFMQVSPESIFTQKTICSRATPEGRVTLANDRLIQTQQGTRKQRAIATPTDYRHTLATHFGITLPPNTPLEVLMQRTASR